MIELGSFNTGNNLHGTIQPSQWDYDRHVQSWFGAVGEVHLLGQLHGRDLSTWLWLTGYSTQTAIQLDLKYLHDSVGTSGTLYWSSLTETVWWENVILIGFDAEEQPWLDGSGVNGWQCKGTIRFRQVAE